MEFFQLLIVERTLANMFESMKNYISQMKNNKSVCFDRRDEKRERERNEKTKMKFTNLNKSKAFCLLLLRNKCVCVKQKKIKS